MHWLSVAQKTLSTAPVTLRTVAKAQQYRFTHFSAALARRYDAPIVKTFVNLKVEPLPNNEAHFIWSLTSGPARICAASYANTFGTLQGGIISTLHDIVASQAVYTTGSAGMHATANVQYLEAITLNPNDIVSGHASITKLNKSSCFTNSTIFINGKIASQGQHTFVLKPQHVENRKTENESTPSNTASSAQSSEAERTD